MSYSVQKTQTKKHIMKNTTIEFNSETSGLITSDSPWTESVNGSYQDMLLKQEFATRRYKFPVGETWFRIVPSLKGSAKGPILGAYVLNYKSGRHVHPRTLNPGAKSVFDAAYQWYKTHRPEDLYSKQNKVGLKLLADPVCLLWMITELDGHLTSRLLTASGYSGGRGGTAGLGHQIWDLSRETDEDGQLLGNPADPMLGTQICVLKQQAPGARFPSYLVKRGRLAAPINEMLDKMTNDDVSVITALEDVIRIPAHEEEWQLLENVIGKDNAEQIRNDLD